MDAFSFPDGKRKQQRKRPKAPPRSSASIQHLFKGFEKEFVRMLCRFAPLNLVFDLRMVCRRWRDAIDSHAAFWAQTARALAPLQDQMTRQAVCFHSLQRIHEGHLVALQRLFHSSDESHQYLTRRILCAFLQLPLTCIIRLRPATHCAHPAASVDPFSFYLEVIFPNVKYPRGRFTFFCVEREGILWRKDYPNFQWNTVSVVALTQPYIDLVQ